MPWSVGYKFLARFLIEGDRARHRARLAPAERPT
jgi:hypothetical protein